MKVACVKNNLEDPLKRGLWPPGQVFAAGIKWLNVRSVGETPVRRREPLRGYFADGGKLRFRSGVRKAFAMTPARAASPRCRRARSRDAARWLSLARSRPGAFAFRRGLPVGGWEAYSPEKWRRLAEFDTHGSLFSPSALPRDTTTRTGTSSAVFGLVSQIWSWRATAAFSITKHPCALTATVEVFS
jgi:hypothetical protein